MSLRITTAAAAGTPEVDADVVAISPRALLDPGRLFACDVCGRRFHRVHNLHKHRRLHTTTTAASGKKEKKRKVVFVCPEASCPRHDPAHGMPSFAGIKSHFRQKHRGTQAQATRSAQQRQEDTYSLTRSADKESLNPSSSLGVAAAKGAGGDPDGVAAASSRPFDPVFTPLTPPSTRSCSSYRRAKSARAPPLPPTSGAARRLLPFPTSSCLCGSTAEPRARLRRRWRQQQQQRRGSRRMHGSGGGWRRRRAGRAEARRQEQLAQHERAVARRVRQQAQAELSFSAAAHAVRSHAMIPPCCFMPPPVATAATGSTQHGRPQQPWAPRSPAT